MWFNYCTAIVEQGDFQYKRMFGKEGRKEFRSASWGYRNIMHSQINAFIKNKWRTVLKKSIRWRTQQTCKLLPCRVSLSSLAKM